jgi:hypothetical protein
MTLFAHHQLILGIPFALPALLIFGVLAYLKLRAHLRS